MAQPPTTHMGNSPRIPCLNRACFDSCSERLDSAKSSGPAATPPGSAAPMLPAGVAPFFVLTVVFPLPPSLPSLSFVRVPPTRRAHFDGFRCILRHICRTSAIYHCTDILTAPSARRDMLASRSWPSTHSYQKLAAESIPLR